MTYVEVDLITLNQRVEGSSPPAPTIISMDYLNNMVKSLQGLQTVATVKVSFWSSIYVVREDRIARYSVPGWTGSGHPFRSVLEEKPGARSAGSAGDTGTCRC